MKRREEKIETPLKGSLRLLLLLLLQGPLCLPAVVADAVNDLVDPEGGSSWWQVRHWSSLTAHCVFTAFLSLPTALSLTFHCIFTAFPSLLTAFCTACRC